MSHLIFVYLDDGLGPQTDKYSANAASIIQRKSNFMSIVAFPMQQSRLLNTKNFGLKNMVPLSIQDVDYSLVTGILDKHTLNIL